MRIILTENQLNEIVNLQNNKLDVKGKRVDTLHNLIVNFYDFIKDDFYFIEYVGLYYSGFKYNHLYRTITFFNSDDKTKTYILKERENFKVKKEFDNILSEYYFYKSSFFNGKNKVLNDTVSITFKKEAFTKKTKYANLVTRNT